VTLCLRVGLPIQVQTVPMDRDSYIASIVEAYIPEASFEEKLALTQEFWGLFGALARIQNLHRFDNNCPEMLESESDDQSNHRQSP
jgi:hypothetical protein